MSLFSKKTVDEPGIKGVVRDCLRSDRALNKLGEGDIVVVDAPDITRVLAQRIIDWRTANGPFTDPEQLLEVDGIGQATLDRLRDHITTEETGK